MKHRLPRTVLLIVLALLLSGPSEAGLEALPGVRIRGPVIQAPLPREMTFEDAELYLESGTADHNLNIMRVNHIGKAIAERTGKPFHHLIFASVSL